MRRLALIAPLVLTAAVEAGPGFWLPGLAPGTTYGSANALSQDGLLAVGGTSNGDMAPGYSWSSAGGRYDFGLEQDKPPLSMAFGVSSDGGVIVGWMGKPVNDPPYTTRHAYRWTGSGPLEDLGVLPGETRSYAQGVSGDGQIVVGTCEHGKFTKSTGQAFRWTPQQGIQGLGYLKPGGYFSEALAISRNGSTIVGISKSDVIDAVEAYSWTEIGGMTKLADLPDAPFISSHAEGVNANGSVVVGASVASDGLFHAVRWTQGGVQDLGMLPGTYGSFAYAASDDGLVVAGSATHGGPGLFYGLVWTPATGAVRLDEYLAAHGVKVPAGYLLTEVLAVSGDGTTFAGIAFNLNTFTQESFVATVPSPASLLVLAPLLLARRRRG